MSSAYSAIVGLGFDCRVSFNLRETFGIRRAYPFDWWVTPLPSLVSFLSDPSIDRLYDPTLLEPVMSKGGPFGIQNSHYQILLYHEFPRGKDKFVRDNWRDHIQSSRERTAYLVTRFLGLASAGGRVLFVRAFKRSAERKALKGRLQALIAELRISLMSALPGLGFDLLLIDPVEPVELANVRTLVIDDPARADWRGTPSLWRKRLQGAGVRLAPDGLRSGEDQHLERRLLRPGDEQDRMHVHDPAASLGQAMRFFLRP